MRDLLDTLALPMRSLAVAFIGACLASGWFKDARVAAGIVVVTAIALGYACDYIGSRRLPDSPRAAIPWLEGWILIPVSVGAVGAAAIVVIAVELAAPESATAATKELAKAGAAALTAFVTSAMVSRESDKSESPFARRIRRKFMTHYKRGPAPLQPGVTLFARSSPGEMWVYSGAIGGVEGWGYNARRLRAEGIATELNSGNSNVPNEAG